MLEPGDATRYYVTFFYDRMLMNNDEVGISLLQGTGFKAGIFATSSLNYGWSAIEGLDVNERVQVEVVLWLADKMEINPYTAAAIYQAYKAWLIEREAALYE